ncbi:PREDICTED: allergin-1 isoform X4 [Crocodylus porosus]|uniref:allergin-1 isoform X4 n=1 Tax=Crocodylus porosus TaxID=8502 RepID=UPI00093DC528|nr:PREDICTED: allergin-1 isoform X4 [Crocodylus porosus]
MLTFMTLLVFLLSHFQATQQTENSEENGNELLSNPEVKLLKGSSEVMIGQNVTITCLSGSGSLPVSYTLFRDNQKLFTETKSERKPATFILTIKSASDIGKYTCKATNEIRKEAKYSKSFIFTLIEAVSQPVLSSPTSRVKTGQNVTLFCLSENGSHPITYRFFRGNKSISPPICVEGKAAANISLTIKSSNFLGDYKCKAENKIPNSKKYSNSLRFTLSEKAGISYLLCISLVVFLLLVVMVIAVAIPFLFLPWYKARKLKSPKSATGFVSDQTESETCVIYTEIANNESDQQQYANISIIRKEKGDRVNLSTDTVDYSEVFISRIQGMLKENHLSL